MSISSVGKVEGDRIAKDGNWERECSQSLPSPLSNWVKICMNLESNPHSINSEASDTSMQREREREGTAQEVRKEEVQTFNLGLPLIHTFLNYSSQTPSPSFFYLLTFLFFLNPLSHYINLLLSDPSPLCRISPRVDKTQAIGHFNLLPKSPNPLDHFCSPSSSTRLPLVTKRVRETL